MLMEMCLISLNRYFIRWRENYGFNKLSFIEYFEKLSVVLFDVVESKIKMKFDRDYFVISEIILLLFKINFF